MREWHNQTLFCGMSWQKWTSEITNQWAVNILGGSTTSAFPRGDERLWNGPLPQKLSAQLPSWKSILPRFMDPRIPYRNTATQLTKVLDYGVQIFYFRILKSSQAIHSHALLRLSSLRTLPRGFVRPLSTQPSCFIYLVGSCTSNLVPVHPGRPLLPPLLFSGTVSSSFCWWENHKATS